MQNNACRMILRAGKYDNVENMHLELGLDYLVERRLFHTSTLVFKIENDLIKCPHLKLLFDNVADQHEVNTRASTRGYMVVPVYRTIFGSRSIQVLGSKIWNSLPLFIRESKTLDTFTRLYWKYFSRRN